MSDARAEHDRMVGIWNNGPLAGRQAAFQANGIRPSTKAEQDRIRAALDVSSRPVAPEREALIEFFSRVTLRGRAVDGVVSIGAEDMADALLAADFWAPASGVAITDEMVERATLAMYEARPMNLDQDDDKWDTLPEDWQEEWREGARAALRGAFPSEGVES